MKHMLTKHNFKPLKFNKDKKKKEKKVKKEKNKLSRNSNLELLRIISMLFLICFNTILHGKVLEHSQNGTLSVIVFIIELITLVHVNSFVLLTGYFQSEKEFKMSKVWSLLNSSLFYKVTIMLFLVSFGYITVTKVDILKNISFIPIETHWFIRTFLPLYLFSPFINKLIKKLTQKEYLKLLGISFVLVSVISFIMGVLSFPNDGFTLYQFIFLYLIGGYLKKYPLEKSYLLKKCSKQLFQVILISVFLSCVLLNFCTYITVFALKDVNTIFNAIYTTMSQTIMWYSNPFVIIQTVAYLLFFNTLNIKSKLINMLSSLTCGIYLIHDNVYVRNLIYVQLGVDKGPIYSTRFVLYILLVTVVIYVVCAVIEFCRQLLFKFIKERKISIKLRNKFNEFVGNIKITSFTKMFQQ